MAGLDSLFALETVTMAVCLSIGGWASIEIFNIKGTLAGIEQQEVANSKVGETVYGMRETLIRVEEGQAYLKKYVQSNGEDIRDLSKAIRKLEDD